MKVTFLVPTFDNDGKKFPRAKLNAIFDRVGLQFGGRSVEGPIDGMWVDGGTIYRDQSFRVIVALDDSRLAEVRDLVREIGSELGQLAMYLEVNRSDAVEILRIE